MTAFELTRKWFDFSFENKEAKVQHTAIFLWIIELNNRLGWKSEFGLPTHDTMEGLSIGNKNTYLSALRELEKWGFIKIVKASKNQYQANIISICRIRKVTALRTALDTALIHHSNSTGNGIDNSIDPIDKQVNKETSKQIAFEKFWNKYPVKVAKAKCKPKFLKLDADAIETILSTIDAFVEYKPFESYRHPNPETYLNQERWADEIELKSKIKTDGTDPNFISTNGLKGIFTIEKKSEKLWFRRYPHLRQYELTVDGGITWDKRDVL